MRQTTSRIQYCESAEEAVQDAAALVLVLVTG
jgi:hypothetical protein